MLLNPNSKSSVKRRDSEKKSKMLRLPKKLSKVNMTSSRLKLMKQRRVSMQQRKHTLQPKRLWMSAQIIANKLFKMR
jgi:hypothetical protein